MCLITNSPAIKIAREDIKCYKVIKTNGIGGWETPYTHAHVSHFAVMGKQLFRATEREQIKEHVNWDDGFTVEGGFIHTYSRYTDAKRTAMSMSNAIVYECIIPKGIGYFIGYDSGGDDGYASKAIAFVKRIDFPIVEGCVSGSF